MLDQPIPIGNEILRGSGIYSEDTVLVTNDLIIAGTAEIFAPTIEEWTGEARTEDDLEDVADDIEDLKKEVNRIKTIDPLPRHHYVTYSSMALGGGALLISIILMALIVCCWAKKRADIDEYYRNHFDLPSH